MTVGRETRGRFRGTGRGLPRADSAGPSCHVLKRPPAGMEGPKQPRGPLDASHRPRLSVASHVTTWNSYAGRGQGAAGERSATRPPAERASGVNACLAHAASPAANGRIEHSFSHPSMLRLIPS